jgi:hypothetical protein
MMSWPCHACHTLAVALALCAACSDDPVSYSAPVGITLKARSANASNGVVADEKSINTESGNPYGAFVSAARARIGRDPSIIDVEGVEVGLGPGSTGVAILGDVFTGTVDLVFQMNDTNITYPVATGIIAADTTAGPVPLEVSFVAEEVPDLDYVKLLLGSFKLAARGTAAPAFATKGAEANLQVTLTFAAFE